MRGRMVKSSEAAAFAKEIKWLALGSKCRCFESGDVTVQILLHPKTKKDGMASDVRLDLDNCQKVVLDALNGVAYTDDKQITHIEAEVVGPIQGGGVTVSWGRHEKAV